MESKALFLVLISFFFIALSSSDIFLSVQGFKPSNITLYTISNNQMDILSNHFLPNGECDLVYFPMNMLYIKKKNVVFLTCGNLNIDPTREFFNLFTFSVEHGTLIFLYEVLIPVINALYYDVQRDELMGYIYRSGYLVSIDPVFGFFTDEYKLQFQDSKISVLPNSGSFAYDNLEQKLYFLGIKGSDIYITCYDTKSGEVKILSELHDYIFDFAIDEVNKRIYYVYGALNPGIYFFDVKQGTYKLFFSNAYQFNGLSQVYGNVNRIAGTSLGNIFILNSFGGLISNVTIHSFYWNIVSISNN